MNDLETIIRAAAQKLAKKYSLPTHIVEEDLWHDLKENLSQLQCGSGTTQSRPHPARAVKIMVSAE